MSNSSENKLNLAEKARAIGAGLILFGGALLLGSAISTGENESVQFVPRGGHEAEDTVNIEASRELLMAIGGISVVSGITLLASTGNVRNEEAEMVLEPSE